ncbi:hypothetical protein AOLI_G00140970 [Acnodon oligacanthus]
MEKPACLLHTVEIPAVKLYMHPGLFISSQKPCGASQRPQSTTAPKQGPFTGVEQISSEQLLYRPYDSLGEGEAALRLRGREAERQKGSWDIRAAPPRLRTEDAQPGPVAAGPSPACRSDLASRFPFEC